MSVYCLLASLLLATPDASAQAASSAPALLQTIDGSDIVPLVKARGDQHELKRDSVGDPLILAYSQELGHGYQILFYDCTDSHSDCRAVQFRAWFKHTQDIPASEINEWNRTKRLGRVYLDQDADPTVEITVRLNGGVSQAYLADELRHFIISVEKLQQQLGSRVE